MTNEQYIEKMLSSVERILVDTSTLMTSGFLQFITRNKNRFLSEGKKIVVSKAVYSELARHLGSDNPEKRELALAAVQLLALNKNIFQVDSAPLTEEEIAHAFADAQLLAELTLYRSNCNQLLLSNDRRLSCDAYDLNQQQSCKGRRVLVCYINSYGELQCCDCARPTAERIVPEPTQRDTEKYSSELPNELHEKQEDTSWNYDWLSGVIGSAGLGIVYCLYKGGKALIRSIR